MIKKLFILFKLARKLALSDALKIVSKIHAPPLLIRLVMNILSVSFTKNTALDLNLSDEERLCKSLEGMGTTFIKLGQFLATRPDIISEKLSKHLEKLQDRLPPFSNSEAKETVRKNLKLLKASQPSLARRVEREPRPGLLGLAPQSQRRSVHPGVGAGREGRRHQCRL